MPNDILQRIKLALAGKEEIDIGQFQWINLDMIKDEVGDDWIHIRKKIYNAAASHLEKRLGKDDALLRCRGGFILVYADLTGDDAAAQTASLAESVNRFFLGDRVLRNLEISAKNTRLDVADIADFLKRSALQDAPTGEARPGAEDGKPASHAMDGSGWRAINPHQSPPSEATATERRGHASSGPSGGSDQPRKPPHPPARAGYLSGIDATADMQGFASLAFEVPAPEWEDIVFKPCWDVKFNHITASFCLPRRTHNGVTLYGLQTLLGNREPTILQSMDHAVAVTAQRGFLKQFATGRKCAVVIPVQYNTVIGTQDRIRYFSILQKVPQKARKYFYLRVDDIPDGAPIGQMEELFRSMRIFGSNLLAKIPPGTIRLDRFDNCSVAIFSTSLQPGWAHSGLPESMVKKLADQAISIRKKSKRGALTQVDSLDELRFGLDAGYEIFTGAIISDDQPLPSPLTALNLDDITKSARSAA